MDQFLKCVYNYLTQSDWDIIRNPKKSFEAKMSTTALRLNLVGCGRASEQTLKWVLALLLLVSYDELPPAKTRYQKLQDLKNCMTAERKAWGLEVLQGFPDTPGELPDAIYQHAYSEGPPVSVELSGLGVIAEKFIPLRKTQSC